MEDSKNSPANKNLKTQSLSVPSDEKLREKMSQRQLKIVEEFSALQNWEERYKRIIERGKTLKDFPKDLYDDKYKVRGCQSQVWLHARLTPEGLVEFSADSDALIVKGLVALLLEVYSLATPSEILQASPNFLKEIGLDGQLSPSRANGLYAMVKQIFYYAQALEAVLKIQGSPKN